MGRPTKPPTLKYRKDDGRWYVVYKGDQTYTGDRGPEGKEAAERFLASYMAEKYLGRPAEPVGPSPLSKVSVDEVLGHYLDVRSCELAAPERQSYAVIALMKFWTGKTCADIDAVSCKAYAGTRKTMSTARRELGVLRAALNLANGTIISSSPPMWLPSESDPRPVWFTRSQVARLIRELRKRKKTRHAAYFVLCMYYTGSRPGVISRSMWEWTPDNPWVDIARGIWWRRGDEEVVTRKTRNPHGIPRRLLFHLRLWRKAMMRRFANGTGTMQKYIIEHPRHPGKPVKDINRALKTACKNAGLPPLTKHALKHSAITNAIMDGMSREDAADYYSTTVQTIDGTYWHMSPFFQERAKAVVNNLGRTVMHGNEKKRGKMRQSTESEILIYQGV